MRRPLMFILALVLACLALRSPAPLRAQGPGPATVLYPAGWNLVAAPPGSVGLPPGPYFTTSSGTDGYTPEARPGGGPGFWGYFPAPAAVELGVGAQAPALFDSGAGVWTMIGNPSGVSAATVLGASVVLGYDPSLGLVQVTQLAPGEGAWAVSLTGSAITVVPAGPGVQQPEVGPLPLLAARPGAGIPIVDPSVSNCARADLGLPVDPTNVNCSGIPGAGGPTNTPTAICNDGWLSTSQHRQGTCSDHGGVAQFLVNLPP